MKNIFKSIQPFLLIFLVLSTPFTEFINVNYWELTAANFWQLFVYFLSILIFYFLIYILVRFLIPNKFIKNIIFLYTCIFFWSLFKFEKLQIILGGSSNKLSAELSLVFILALLVLSFIFFFREKKTYKIGIKFIFFFFVAQNIILYSNIVFKNFDKVNLIENNFSNFNYLTKKEVTQIKKKKNQNIYFVILDEMTSLGEFKKMYNYDLDDFMVFYNLNDYNYIKNTNSSFDVSPTTIASILNLKPIALPGINIFKSGLTNRLYPNLLSKQNFDIKLYPNLISSLKKIDYEFKWIGNTLANCQIYNVELCIDFKNKKNEKDLISTYLDVYVLYSFLKSTPLDEIYRIMNKLKKNKTIGSNNYYLENDAIDKFINYGKIYSSHFYFIHQMLPHSPYIYDENCNYKNDDMSGNIQDQLRGYKLNYICALKKIEKLINYLSKKDPNSIVIIQGDHGFKNNIPTKEPLNLKQFKIFNLIKVPDYCKSFLNDKIDNINAARLALSCATESDIKLLEPQIYYSLKTNKKFGEVKVLD